MILSGSSVLFACMIKGDGLLKNLKDVCEWREVVDLVVHTINQVIRNTGLEMVYLFKRHLWICSIQVPV